MDWGATKSRRHFDEQRKNIPNQTKSLIAMADLAKACRSVVLNSPDLLIDIGAIINKSWIYKRYFSSSVTSLMIDDLIARANKAGAISSKIAGAGGGGFLYVLANQSDHQIVRDALSEKSVIKLNYCPFGAKVLVLI